MSFIFFVWGFRKMNSTVVDELLMELTPDAGIVYEDDFVQDALASGIAFNQTERLETLDLPVLPSKYAFDYLLYIRAVYVKMRFFF